MDKNKVWEDFKKKFLLEDYQKLEESSEYKILDQKREHGYVKVLHIPAELEISVSPT